jgi:broad specificity phosphatase PhoE
MKHLYFVRHGLSEMNVEGKYSSSTNTPLTQIGTEQAIAAGKWARENGIVFDVVLSSPLSRAHETAKHIATEVNYNHEDIILHDDLRERHFGAIEGVHWKDVPFDQAAYKSDPFILDTIENAERIADLQYRANQMYDYIATLPQDTILVVSHGSFGRAFQRSVKNLPIAEFGDRLDNAKIIKLV